MLALTPRSAAAQAHGASAKSGPTSPEPVLGIQMGTNRHALNDYLVARGWVLVADSIAGAGTPSLYAGALVGRPAEIIAMFGPWSGRLVNLAINVPAASPKELGATYADLYRLLEHARCAPKLPADYAVQLDSILRGAVPYLPGAGSVETYSPVLPSHTTPTPTDNTDWPSPIWVNAAAAIGTQLIASRLNQESRWPFQATLWSSVELMIDRASMCADSRAAVDSAARAIGDERLARRRSRSSGDAPVLDSVLVMAAPGVTLRVDSLVVQATDTEPDGALRILRRSWGSTLHYDARLAPEYEALEMVVADTVAAASGTMVLDTTSMIIALARPRPRAETKHLYELLRAELTSKNPLAAQAMVECEMERLQKEYPATASRWIKEVQERAHDPQKDMKAMRRFDAAMGGHTFGGCAEDRRQYPASH